MTSKDLLSTGEILAILGLLTLDGSATTEQLKDFMKTSDQYVRNITVKLRKRGIISSVGALELRAGIIFGSPISRVTLKPRQKLHVLTVDLEELVNKHPEILRFAKSVLKVNSLNELKKYLECLKKQIQ